MSHTDTPPSESDAHSVLPDSFEALAASRRHWIDTVLHPWCQQATCRQLRQAEVEWLDIAGRVDVNATLWTWAWERFAVLTHAEMAGVNETHRVRVTLQEGTVAEGYPDSRLSVRGSLVLIGKDAFDHGTVELGPYLIDDIATVEVV